MSDETTPVTPPSTPASLRPRKIRSRNQGASLSGGHANLERAEEVENIRDTVNTTNKVSHGAPNSCPELPLDVRNGSTSPDSWKTGPSPADTPSVSVRPMPIWKLEIKIKQVILKATAEKEGQAYIFADPTDEAGYFKLGRSGTPLTREQVHQDDCNPSFELLDVVPEAYSVPWASRLESLAHAELTNMKYSFDCPCSKSHKEYFTGKAREGFEILNCWSSWLQRNPHPYDQDLQLSPFWRDRLSLLGGGAFSHLRCPNNECLSTGDIRFSSCQSCLRLRLKAWTDATDLDHFQYECRMRVGWSFLRQVMYWTWPRFGDHFLILVDGWDKMKLVATIFWAPTTHFHLLLALMVWLWSSSNLPRESLVYLILSCLVPYWRIRNGLADTQGDSQLTKVQTMPRARGKVTTRKVSISPRPETPPEIVGKEETSSHEEEPPSEKLSVSVNEPINNPRIFRGHESATAACEMSEPPEGEHKGPQPFLTPDRATRTVGRRSPRAGAKRRKSDVH